MEEFEVIHTASSFLREFCMVYNERNLKHFINNKEEKAMKYKDIEAAREARLWIGQVIVPVAGTVLLLMSNPQFRDWAECKTRKARNGIYNMFHKTKRI